MINIGIYNEAKYQLKMKNYKKYNELIKQLYKIEPSCTVIKYEYAQSLRRSGQIKLAVKLFNELLETENRFIALYELAMIDINNKKYDEALEKLNEVLENRPDDKYARRKLGKIYLIKGNEEKAKEVYSYLTDSEYIALCMTDMASFKIIHGMYDEALEYLDLAVLNFKNEEFLAYVYYEYGIIKIKMQDYYGAINVLKKGLKYDWHDTKIYIKLAYVYDALNFPFEAEKTLETGLKKTNNDKIAFELANHYKNHKKYDEAISIINSITNEEIAFDAQLLLAKIYIRQCKHVEAEKIFENLWNSSHKLNILIEYIIYENKVLNLDKALKLLNDNQQFKDNLLYKIQYAKTLFVQGKIEESLSMFEEIEKIQGSLLSKTYIIYCYCRLKDYQKAKELFQSLNRVDFPFSNDEYERLNTYLNYKLGVEDNKKGYYYSEQLKFYSKQRTIEHIKKHFMNDNDSLNISTLELYEDVLNKITEMKPYNKDICDVYLVNFDDSIGKVKGLDIYKATVITMPDTKEILTIYPNEKLDDDAIDKNLDNPKVKKISRIDWFNQKYNIKK